MKGSIKNLDFRKKVASSIFWTVVGRSSISVTSFIVLTLLAHLLTLAEFGVFALASIFVDVTRIIATSGWTDVVVREPVLEKELLDTAFWSNLVFGLVVAMFAIVFAVPYANWTDQPVVAHLIWCLAPLTPVSCLGSIHVARALHDFGYRAVATRNTLASFLGGVGAVGAAVGGWGVWSLVVQALIVDLVNVVAAWTLMPWMPGKNVSWQRLKVLTAFTSSILLAQLMWLLLIRISEVFISRNLGASAVGAYRIGFRSFELLGQLVLAPIASVALPTFSRLHLDPEKLHSAFYRLIGLLALMIFPIMAGFGTLADLAVPLVFGAKWQNAVPVAQILMGLMVPYLLSFFESALCVAVGRSSYLSRIAVVQLALTTVLAWFAAPYGLAVVAAAYVLRSYLSLIYEFYIIRQATAIKPSATLRAILPALAATLVMVVLLLEVRHLRPPVADSAILQMAILVLIGAAGYLGILALGFRRYCLDQVMFVSSLLPSRLSKL